MIVTVNGKDNPLRGTVSPVASKSVAHRLLICAALAGEESLVRCQSVSNDINATVRCLQALGAVITREGDVFRICPGKGGDGILDCGDSGSTQRFLLPVVCALGRNAQMVLRGRLSQRPLSPLYEELCSHGCTLSPQGSNPLLISGQLRAGKYTLRADVSSQFISGLLFALPLCEGDSTLTLTGKRESASYIDLTLNALKIFGIVIESTETGYRIPGGQTYRSPGMVETEGDWSSASFWKVAKFLGADVETAGMNPNSLQGDRVVVSVLEQMAAGNCVINAENIPDCVPALSVAALGAPGETVICGAARLRLKESDRLQTTADMLRALGAQVDITEDGLRIRHDAPLHPGTVDAAGDHRIAMSAAIASILCGDVTIVGAEHAAKSYPAFWDDFAALGGSVRVDEQ